MNLFKIILDQYESDWSTFVRSTVLSQTLNKTNFNDNVPMTAKYPLPQNLPQGGRFCEKNGVSY